MKIFRSVQIKAIDEYTIKHEPVSSVDLMERAAGMLLKWYMERFDRSGKIFIFAGPGNNGGDGIALARMLSLNRYDVELFYIKFTETTSPDWVINRQRLQTLTNVPFHTLTSADQFPVVTSDDRIFDAIFGSGLTRPVKGLAAEIIKMINLTDALRISIDIPSGLFGEDNSDNSFDSIVKADYTLSFQFPKLSFLFPDNSACVGEWEVLDIGLNQNIIGETITSFELIENIDILPLLKVRDKYDHKGNFGHGLMVAGSIGKMGAAVLSGKAALKTGIGLLSCHIPSCGTIIVQTALPEAMVRIDKSEKYISGIENTDLFSAVGIGPGLGIEPGSMKALHQLLTDCRKPIVLDADALNIMSLNKEWFSVIPAGTIVTPHPKEFERMAGKCENAFTRLQKQREFSEKYKCIVVLKGAHTSVTYPDGKVFFNSTGNPGMATGGSGDVLTGIILSLLSQGYTPEHASIIGVYLHGLAGDIAAEKSGYESIIASDIINSIGKAFNKIREP
jgi:ADP-dependent NAD(P)H-hydrate dehydratase / NAD(P)H-hydrate epimerase